MESHDYSVTAKHNGHTLKYEVSAFGLKAAFKLAQKDADALFDTIEVSCNRPKISVQKKK